MPLFDYADLVWGDKHNVTLMTSLQVLQNKAAKIILDRPLYSSATHALATLKWVPLEKGVFREDVHDKLEPRFYCESGVERRIHEIFVRDYN